MILAGLQKNSFIDFPGKISCVLFTSGCNFTCPYCHNPDLARGEYPLRIPDSQALDFMTTRKGMLDGVVITGGEPTLDDGLAELCRAIKSLGYPVKLDTNGSCPDVLKRLLDRDLVDFVAMDIKAPVDAYGPFSRLPDIGNRILASIRIVMNTAPAHEFRTTCAAPFVNSDVIETIAETIAGADCYALQSFNPHTPCLDPEFSHHHDPAIAPESMQRLKTLAEPFVGRCIIR